LYPTPPTFADATGVAASALIPPGAAVSVVALAGEHAAIASAARKTARDTRTVADRMALDWIAAAVGVVT
jgi:hypothetical protein